MLCNYNKVINFYKKYDKFIILILFAIDFVVSIYLSIRYKIFFTNCYEYNIPDDAPCKKNILCDNNTMCQSSGYCLYKNEYEDSHEVCKCYFSCNNVNDMFFPLFTMTVSIMFILALAIYIPFITCIFCLNLTDNNDNNSSYKKLNEDTNPS